MLSPSTTSGKARGPVGRWIDTAARHGHYSIVIMVIIVVLLCADVTFRVGSSSVPDELPSGDGISISNSDHT